MKLLFYHQALNSIKDSLLYVTFCFRQDYLSVEMPCQKSHTYHAKRVKLINFPKNLSGDIDVRKLSLFVYISHLGCPWECQKPVFLKEKCLFEFYGHSNGPW